MMTKIFIDPGHGGSDPGAVGRIKEADYTLPYALELGRILSSLGLQIMYSRTTNATVSLADRCKMANQANANYFISIHFNAGGGTGIETHALAPGGNGEKLAKAVQSSLIEYTGMRDRGVKFSNFQVLRDTKMPAILIEGGFVDSDDADKIKTEAYKQNFVRGASKGICAFLGLAWTDPYAEVSTMNENKATKKTEKSLKERLADDDTYLSVRVRESKVEKAIEEITKLGYACKRMDLA